MAIINKLTDKEKRLLLIFFTLLILVGSYQFGYLKYTEKAETIKTENQTLTNQLNELQQKQAKKDRYAAETEDLKQKTSAILSKFPAGLTAEKCTVFVTDLENSAGMKVTSVTYQDVVPFYTTTAEKESNDNGSNGENNSQTAGNEESAVTETASSEANNTETGDLEASNTDTNEISPGGETASSGSGLKLTGYRTSMVLTYQTTYAGLKNSIDYINNYSDKLNISDLTAAFDNTTGNLTGTMTILVYAAEGTGRKYEAPDINNVNIGTENIFGTFEIPINEDKN